MHIARRIASSPWRRRARALVLLSVGCAGWAGAQAGLDIVSMQDRNDAAADGLDDMVRLPFGLVTDDGAATLTLQAGARPQRAPPLVAPMIDGGNAARVGAQLPSPGAGTADIEVHLGASWHEGSPPRLEGSRVSWRLGPGAAYAAYERRHWGPGWFGSLILDGAAPPVPTVGWQGGRRYADHASWSADVFAGPLAGSPAPAHPKLIGMHAEWRPNSDWSAAIARTLQWGGSGRPESLRSLFDALTSNDTVGRSGIDLANEPGNQLASLDLRYRRAIDPHRSVETYVQWVAEDKANWVPSRRLWQVGGDASLQLGPDQVRLIVEGANTSAGGAPGLAYRHHTYLAGYAQRGEVLGFPAGGDVRLGSLGMLWRHGPLFGVAAAHRGRALDGAQLFTPGARLDGLDGALCWQAAPSVKVGVSVQRWHAEGTVHDTSAQLWTQANWR